MKQIINSEKRIVQISVGSATVGTVATIPLVRVESNPVSASASTVAIGTVIKAIYVEIWLMSVGTTVATTTTIIAKYSGESDNPNSTDMGDLNAWTNKKNILETHQGLLAEDDSNPTPFYRGWIKIPKGKQRFGQGDLLQYSVKAITGEVQWCGVAIFKAYN